MKVTRNQIEKAYDVANRVYDKRLSKEDGIKYLVDAEMNPNTATIYILVFDYLMKGVNFSRTLNAESFDFYLERILDERGLDQLYKSLGAFKKHIEYFENLRNVQMKLLRATLTKYSNLYGTAVNLATNNNDVDYDEVFPEGKLKFRLHQSRERNQELVRKAKERYFQIDPYMSCQVCGISFGIVYGELGKDFIEAHHTTPVSNLDENSITRLEDLAMVCSNCHQMLHRMGDSISVPGLTQIVKNLK